jgi:hypothetical protein
MNSLLNSRLQLTGEVEEIEMVKSVAQGIGAKHYNGVPLCKEKTCHSYHRHVILL